MSTHPRPTRTADRFTSLARLFGRAPRWLSIGLGVVLVGVGALLVTRPLTALGVLGWYLGLTCIVAGAAELLSAAREREEAEGKSLSPRRTGLLLRVAAAGGWILAGIALLVWVGRDAGLLGPVVAVLLIGSGVTAIVRLLWERTSERWLAALFGLSEISFGLLALLWPDATLVIVAILFGGRTVLLGLWLIARGIVPAGREPRDSTKSRGGRWVTALRWTSAAALLVLAGITLMISHAFRDGAPVVDAFYDVPADMPDTPGHLLRWEHYDGDLPEGITGYRLLYVTTDAAGRAIPASAALGVPDGTTGPAPLITWAHGTVGVARACAPTIGPDAISDSGIPAMDAFARNGWALVATDYPGMGTAGNFPYLIGPGQGLAVLDAARAARQIPGVQIAETTAIWGHSQGGHAALWAGQLASDYAPDLDVVGTAALSPASNPEGMAEAVFAHPDALGASLGISYVVDAYTRYYDDLNFDDVVARSARTIVREAAARCTSEGGTLVTVLSGLAIARDQPIVNTGALEGPFGERLRQNIPHGPWAAPLLIGQGEADEVIPFTLNQEYVAELCRAGVEVEFQGYPGGSHMSVVENRSALSIRLEEWTQARLAGEPAAGNCG